MHQSIEGLTSNMFEDLEMIFQLRENLQNSISDPSRIELTSPSPMAHEAYLEGARKNRRGGKATKCISFAFFVLSQILYGLKL